MGDWWFKEPVGGVVSRFPGTHDGKALLAVDSDAAADPTDPSLGCPSTEGIVDDGETEDKFEGALLEPVGSKERRSRLSRGVAPKFPLD